MGEGGDAGGTLDEFHAVEAELDRRWPESRLEPGLKRISALVDLLGDPQRAFPVVHVAGTNGKTSVTRMIDALLTEAGLRTGRYTSPHLQRATERISLDNHPISADRYVEVFREIEPYLEIVDSAAGSDQPRLSKFEVLTAMAFAAFADAPVEAAVVEVGLGGTWDATNVADGVVSVVCPIGVITATVPSVTFVASHRPPRPTSTIPASTGASANAANAIAVSTSNLLSGVS